MYLIDGHNLIARVPGLSLRAMDDEMQLVNLLQVFCRVRRRKVEVYFDGAPPGFARTKAYGQVTAHFVQERIQADDAILARLKSLGRRARNWVVVTSDNRISAQARSQHARVVSSDTFAGELIDAQRLAFDPPATGKQRSGSSQATVSNEEIEYWLRLFENGKDEENH